MPSQLVAVQDKLLTGVSNMPASNAEASFLSEILLPSVQVKQDSGKIGKYGTGHLRIERSIMGGKGAARRVDVVARSSDSYLLEKHGLEAVVTEEDYNNVEDPFDAEADEVMALTSMIRLEKEKVWADSLFSGSVMTNTVALSGTARFNDYANSNPLAKAKDAIAAIKGQCGMLANAVVMGWQVYNELKYHPGILEALGFTQERAGLLTYADIAKALDVQKVFVGSAMYDSAVEGQTASLAHIWGKSMLFCVAPDSAQRYQTSVGYYVRRIGEGSREVFKAPLINPPKSKSIIVQDRYDLVVYPAAGYLYTTVID